MQKDVFTVTGMTCAACAARIEKVLRSLPGVEEANINLAAEKLYIAYQPEKIGKKELFAAVDRLGYALEDTAGQQRTVMIPIAGMTCAACALRVEKALQALPGVLSASVNPATDKATVQADASVRLSALREAVSKAGYEPLEASQTAAKEDTKRRQKAVQTLRRKLLFAALFTLPLFYLAMAPMLHFTAFTLPLPSFLHPMHHPLTYALFQLALVLPVLGAGYRFYTAGFRALWQLSPNMDSLIALGTGAAFLYSLYNTFLIGQGKTAPLYYETAGVILTLILLGKLLEAISKGRTGEAVKKLMGLAPRTALVLQDNEEKEIPIDEVEPGDILIVKPGAKIPVDATVLEGHSALNEAMLTGESMPVDKQPESTVYAATLNTTGTLRCKAERVGADTALGRIIQLVEQAQGSKAPIARLADTVSGFFVPAVGGVALLSGLAWLLATGDVSFAFTIFISVLVIACPCALGLATPTAIMVGTGRGAELGILFKGGLALELAQKVDTVLFDKTGTLTEGKPTVTDILPLSLSGDKLLALAAAAETPSEHPLGMAVVNKAKELGLEVPKAENFISLTGRGVQATVENAPVLAGSERLMREKGIAFPPEAEKLAKQGKTPLFIAVNGQPAGLLAVADVEKATARQAIAALQQAGLQVAMITGDTRATAQSVAETLGITRVLPEVLPEDKANEVKKLQAEGHRVAMVGDGINDAPALVQADVGIAVGSGTDVAMESADIVLMRSDVTEVVTALRLGRQTVRNIRQNLFWAFGYNVVGIPIAAGLLYLFGGPLLDPMLAAAAMSLSSVSVLLNALRLKRFGRTKKKL